MNRRGFVSMLAGTAGALWVPWRYDTTPRIFLPSRLHAQDVIGEIRVAKDWSWMERYAAFPRLVTGMHPFMWGLPMDYT